MNIERRLREIVQEWENGGDSAKCAVAKWEAIKAHYQETGVYTPNDASTCTLCLEVDHSKSCRNCRYYITHGKTCISQYNNVRCAAYVDKDLFLRETDVFITKLKEVK